MRAGACYAKLVFLHPVGSAGHIVYYDASGREISSHYFSCSGGPGMVSRNSAVGNVTSNWCFCIRWDMQVT
jgi:hypothetical protein